MSRRVKCYRLKSSDGLYCTGCDPDGEGPFWTAERKRATPFESVADANAAVQFMTARGARVVTVYSTRKPKPAEPKPALVVAGEGLFAVLTEDSGDAHFQDINDGSDGFPRDAQRSIGSREMAIAFVGRWPGNKLVRILADGEHEAAVEAAVRAERERVLGLVAAERERVRGKTSDGYLYALDWFEEAAKGQGK